MSKLLTHQSAGYSYFELMIALAMASAIILGLSGVVGQALHSSSTVHAKNTITRDAHFALQRMTQAVRHTPLLLLPLNDNPNTNWPEHIREQTIPASPPVGDSTLATAVLAITLAHDIDRDKNGIPDADNDGDGLFDEDMSDDTSFDAQSGLIGIDDDGNGLVDDRSTNDDDEDGATNEDAMNAIDADNDGSIDEDTGANMNGDSVSGIAGIDDDNDGSIDEEHQFDDDEDGVYDEDWYDTVVFYLSGNQLIERLPVPWDTNASGSVTGTDFITSVIADNVTHFRVERLVGSTSTSQLIDITIEITSPDSSETVSLNTLVRVGGAL